MAPRLASRKRSQSRSSGRWTWPGGSRASFSSPRSPGKPWCAPRLPTPRASPGIHDAQVLENLVALFAPPPTPPHEPEPESLESPETKKAASPTGDSPLSPTPPPPRSGAEPNPGEGSAEMESPALPPTRSVVATSRRKKKAPRSPLPHSRSSGGEPEINRPYQAREGLLDLPEAPGKKLSLKERLRAQMGGAAGTSARGGEIERNPNPNPDPNPTPPQGAS